MRTEKVLILPLAPNVEDPEDLKRYIRELHKALDEWHKNTSTDVEDLGETAHTHSNKSILDDTEIALKHGITWDDLK